MDQMRTALRGLAETAATAPADDPASLWSQGRRRVRRRRLAAAGAVAAAVVAAGASSLVAVPAAVVHPAGATHEPAIPRNVWTAKDWYPTTSEEGPPGVVAVLGGVIRGDRNGLFTVSATTGEYRLLDLPDALDGLDSSSPPVLAPDGRHIAYWLAGEPSGEPFRDAARIGDGEGSIPVGLGIYDTSTGAVRRYEPSTEHGLYADEVVWADDDTLLLTYGQRTSGTSADRIATYVWETSTDDAPSRTTDVSGTRLGRDTDGALVDLRGRRRAVSLPVDGTRAEEVVRLPRTPGFAAASVWVSSAAVVVPGNELLGGRNNFGEDRTLLGTRRPDGTVRGLRPVDRLSYTRPVGWIDDTHLLAIGDGRTDDEWGAFYRLDVTDGAATLLGTAQAGMYAPGLQVATDLLGAPMVEGDRPPRRNVFWSVAATIPGYALLGGLAVLGVVAGLRRRRRA